MTGIEAVALACVPAWLAAVVSAVIGAVAGVRIRSERLNGEVDTTE